MDIRLFVLPWSFALRLGQKLQKASGPALQEEALSLLVVDLPHLLSQDLAQAFPEETPGVLMALVAPQMQPVSPVFQGHSVLWCPW